MKNTLSKRLLKIASYAKDLDRIADIGSDHSYLAVYLLKNNMISYALCIEAVLGPYGKSVKNLKKYIKQGKADVLLSWGFNDVNCEKIDGAVIAGMGGCLINEILSKDINKIKKLKKLILQPQNNQTNVRKFLHQNNFEITDEAIVYEKEKFYEIICASPSENIALRKEIYYEIPLLCVLQKNPVIIEFIKYKQAKLNNIIKSCLNKDTDLSRNIIIESKNKLNDLEEILRCLQR